MTRLFLAFLCLAAVCGCSRAPAGCDQLYVVLPGNYVIDVAAGSTVALDPGVAEFALFCTPADAQKALAASAPQGDWRVFAVKGEFDDLARDMGGGRYLLARPAQVSDWVEIN